MKRVAFILLVVGLSVVVVQFQIFARGGGGGGGGGGARPAAGGGGFSPSAAPRAAAPAARPAAPAARPSPAAPRPSTGAAAARPGGAAPAARPAGGAPGVGAAAAARPAAGAGNVAGARPSAGQLNNFVDVPAGGAAVAGAAGAARGGGAAADFLQQGAGGVQRPVAAASAVGGPQRSAAGVAAVAAAPGVGRPGVGAPGVGVAPGVGRPGVGAPGVGVAPGLGRPGTPGQNLAQNRPGRIENRDQRQGDRTARRDEIQNQYNQNNPGNFWSENPVFSTWAITRPFAWANWGSVGSWCGYGQEAMPYSYGENVYYADDQVYYGDMPVATTEEYAQQAAALAATDPATAPAQGDWLPLGVFALTQDGQASGAPPTLYMQLAISKQGVIAGTLKNTTSGKVDTLDGMADIKSQRVAWTVAGQQRPIVETGVANLTQDTAPALIHFADGQTQQWLMVRMPETMQPPK